MATYHTPKDYFDAANASTTLPAELRALANAPYGFVVQAVARNPNTEPDLLFDLVPGHIQSDHELYIALAMIENPSTPLVILEILVDRLFPIRDVQPRDCLHMRVILALACSHRTPFTALERLLHPEQAPKHVRQRLAKETERADVVELLLDDPSDLVRKQAQKNRFAHT